MESIRVQARYELLESICDKAYELSEGDSEKFFDGPIREMMSDELLRLREEIGILDELLIDDHVKK